MSQHSCLSCNEEMEIGFVPEASLGGFFVSVWHRGHPDTANKTLLESLASPAGVRFANDQVLVLEAWRCASCGRVELFANRAPRRGELG